MSLLLPYYIFLVAGAALVLALRDNPLLLERPALSLGYLLGPPLVLMFLSLNMGFAFTFLLTVIVSLSLNRLLRVRVGKTTSGIFRLWVVTWCVEAVLPLTLYFALQSHPDLQKLSLLVVSLVLVAATLILLIVVGVDLPRKA